VRLLLPAILLAACGGSQAADVPPPSPATASASPNEPPPPPPSRKKDAVIVLVVDRSGSMSGLPMEMARKGLLEAPDACAGCRFEVIVYDSQPLHLVSLAPGGARDAYDKAVKKIQPGGGTEAVPALELAADLLEKGNHGGHVVFFTDGQFPTKGLDAVVARIGRAAGTLSTIGLGSAGNIDEATLRRIAKTGRGRFHHVEDPAKVPAAFRAEVTPD